MIFESEEVKVISGKCGKDAVWTYDRDSKLLQITGTGVVVQKGNGAACRLQNGGRGGRMDVRSARTGIRDDYIVQRRKHHIWWISYWFGVCMIMVLLSLAGCGSKKDGTDVAVVDVAEKFWKVYEESEQDEIVGKKFSNDSNSYRMEYNEKKRRRFWFSGK